MSANEHEVGYGPALDTIEEVVENIIQTLPGREPTISLLQINLAALAIHVSDVRVRPGKVALGIHIFVRTRNRADWRHGDRRAHGVIELGHHLDLTTICLAQPGDLESAAVDRATVQESEDEDEDEDEDDGDDDEGIELVVDLT
jgi:hypothetical protein